MLRARALRLPEAAGARNGTLGHGPALSVLIIGDSSAAGVGVNAQDTALAGQMTQALARTHTVTWHLHARTGATTASTLATIHELPDQHFDVAVQALGVNDVTRGKTLHRWMVEQEQLVRALQQRHGIRNFWITGMPPMGRFPLLPDPLRWVLGRQAARFDQAQRKRCVAADHLHYLPVEMDLDASTMAEDGFHPGPQVYAAWGQGAAGMIEAALNPNTQDNPPGA